MTDYIIDMTPLNSAGEPITSSGITYINDNQGVSGDVIDMQPYGTIVDYAIIDMIMPAVPEWHNADSYMSIEGFDSVYSPSGKPMYPPGIMGDPSTNTAWSERRPLESAIETPISAGDDVFYIYADNTWFSGFRPSICRIYMEFMEPDHIRILDKAGNLIGFNMSIAPIDINYNGADIYVFEIPLSGQTDDIDRIELREVGPGPDSGYESDIYLFFKGIEFFGVHS